MFKRATHAIAIGITVLFAMLLWRNFTLYKEHSKVWRIGKSCIDLSIIVALAWRLPVLLVAWCIQWIVRPLRNPMARATIGVFASLAFGFFHQYTMEILLVSSVFAVDLVTGNNSFLRHWNETEHKKRNDIEETLVV